MRAMALLLRIAAAREAAYLSEAPALLQCRLPQISIRVFAAACAMLSGVDKSSVLQRWGSSAYVLACTSLRLLFASVLLLLAKRAPKLCEAREPPICTQIVVHWQQKAAAKLC